MQKFHYFQLWLHHLFMPNVNSKYKWYYNAVHHSEISFISQSNYSWVWVLTLRLYQRLSAFFPGCNYISWTLIPCINRSTKQPASYPGVIKETNVRITFFRFSAGYIYLEVDSMPYQQPFVGQILIIN
jgi:hypothetical protein